MFLHKSKVMLSKREKLNILFDLDGTLISQYETICTCINYALEQLGFDPKPREIVYKTIGACLFGVFDEWVGQENTTRAHEFFQEKYTQILNDNIEKMPGVDWILQELHQREHTLTVFTGKDGNHARVICEHIDISIWFTLIVGSHDSPYRKPQKEFTEFALDKLKALSDNAILIGDTVHDVEAAKSVGIPCFLVTTGSNTREELAKHQVPDHHIFDNLYELGKNLFKLDYPH